MQISHAMQEARVPEEWNESMHVKTSISIRKFFCAAPACRVELQVLITRDKSVVYSCVLAGMCVHLQAGMCVHLSASPGK